MSKVEDNIKVKDNVQIVLKGPDGKVKSQQTAHNVITTKGREGYADQVLAAPSIGKPKWMAIGKKSTTAEAESNTALDEESKRKEVSAKERSAKVVTFKASFGAGEGTGEVKEAGIFDAETTGNMYSRVTFGLVTKGAEDTLEIVWTHTIG